MLPDGSDTLLLVTNDEAPEFRLARCPVPRDGDQDHTTWRDRCGSRTRPSGSSRSTPSPTTWCSATAPTGRSGCGSCRPTTSPARVWSIGVAVRARRDHARPERGVRRPRAVLVEEESYVEPAVWSDVSLGRPASGTRSSARRLPGTTRRATSSRRSAFPSADGTPVARDGGAPPGHAAGRHRPRACSTGTAPTRPSTSPSGTRRCPACSTGASSSCTPTSVAAARAAGAGGSTGHLEHKQHTFDDHIAVADGLAAAGLVDGSRIATRGLSAGGLLQGAVFSQRPDRWRAVVAEVPVRRRRHHDARREHPADRERVGRVGRPAPARGLRVDAGLLAVRQPAAGRRAARPARRPGPCTTRG